MRELTVTYERHDKLYKMYHRHERWANKTCWSTARGDRVSKVVNWLGKRLKKEFFACNPKAVWIQSWKCLPNRVVVTFLQQDKQEKLK